MMTKTSVQAPFPRCAVASLLAVVLTTSLVWMFSAASAFAVAVG